MPSVIANGISVYYEQRGDGPPLVLFNGSGATLAASGFLVDVFAQRCAVTVHDQRGLGATGIPEGPYSMADYAQDADALLTVIGIETCAVAGISFGGMVAQEFAIRFPHRVERLALICTSAGGDGGASYPLHDLAGMPAKDRAALAMQLLDTRFCAEWLANHPSDQYLVKAMADRALVDKTADQVRGEYEQLQARKHHNAYNRLSSISTPTLVAAGRFDGIAPPANAQAIAGQIPNAELKVYEGGHAFFAQDPAAFTDILNFLDPEA